MKRNLLTLVAVVSLIVFSCKEESKKTEANDSTSKMEEVMAIHDEVMPKMSTIGKLVAELKPKADTTAQGLPYKEAMTDLQDAHKSMMDWMKGFGDRFDSDEILNGKELSPEKKVWLLEEEVKVKALRDQINGSIEKAEKLLEQ